MTSLIEVIIIIIIAFLIAKYLTGHNIKTFQDFFFTGIFCHQTVPPIYHNVQHHKISNVLFVILLSIRG